MSTSTKSFLVFAVVGAIAGLVAFFGLSPFGKEVVQQIAGSAAGTTFSNAKVAAINITPSSASATSTGILNTDASDRIITDSFVSCSAAGSVQTQALAGVATWNWLMSTSSTQAPAVIANTNYAANLVVATSTTDDSFIASSTSPVLTVNRRWKAGSYLNITANATSSTAACTAGVHYLAS